MNGRPDEAMRLLRECHAMLTLIAKRTPPVFTPAQPFTSATAPDRDLDGPHGDPVIKAKSPRDWTGDDMTGRRFSECPPEYLEMVADRLDYFNTRETDEKKRGYNARDAARARGWAARLRAGWKPAAQAGDWSAEEMPKW